MKQNIKDYLKTKVIDGDIILYRDKHHKKKSMCDFLAQHLTTDKDVCVQSGGAFGLYVAKAYHNNKVVIFGNPTDEYKTQIENLPNVLLIKGKTTTQAKEIAVKNDSLFINQYAEPLIKEYYRKHFVNILIEVGKVDAFCDCGHSCATMAGAIESGADLEFVLGINNANGDRQALHYLAEHKDKFVQETTRNFDTAILQAEIEDAYPSFGNIYEATRSISAAMSWLQKNPNKTVLVYVGDSPVFGADASF